MIVIIGGGISGLYLGYQLLKRKKEFIILEKSPVIGGKVKTQYIDDTNYMESGASIFHKQQLSLINLLDELELSDNIIELSKGRTLSYHSYYGEIPNGDEVAYGILLELLKSNTDDKISIEELINKNLDKEQQDFIKWALSGYEEIKHMNASIQYRSFKHEENICILKGGLSQIINKLGLLLKEHIFKQHIVTNINKVEKYYILTVSNPNKSGIEIKVKNVILATSFPQISKIKFDTTLNSLINNITTKLINIPTLRVYVLFKNEQKWLNNYEYIVSDYKFRWCIKINNKLAMISYTDGQDADYLIKLGKDEGIKLIIKEISKIFNINITLNDIEKLFWFQWNDSFVVWKADTDCNFIKNSIKISDNFYQVFGPDSSSCGENTAWIEAHLRSADEVLKLL